MHSWNIGNYENCNPVYSFITITIELLLLLLEFQKNIQTRNQPCNDLFKFNKGLIQIILQLLENLILQWGAIISIAHFTFINTSMTPHQFKNFFEMI